MTPSHSYLALTNMWASTRHPIEQDLLNSTVVSYQPHGTQHGGQSSAFHVALSSGTEAFHKPQSGIDRASAYDYGHDWNWVGLNECAAWRLALALGSPVSDLVATTVYWSHRGEPGSLGARKHGPPDLAALTAAPGQCMAAAFFDSLIAQQDRHTTNFRWDPNQQQLGLIDHGFAFALPGTLAWGGVFIEWRWNQGRQALEGWEATALQALLASPDLHGMRLVLEPPRADALEQRAQRMLGSGASLQFGDF